jgi:hypothetical protein
VTDGTADGASARVTGDLVLASRGCANDGMSASAAAPRLELWRKRCSTLAQLTAEEQRRARRLAGERAVMSIV